MKSIGIVIGDDVSIGSDGITRLLSIIFSKFSRIDISIFSDQVIGNCPCPKFCRSELVSFNGEIVTFTINDLISCLSISKKNKPIFLFDKQKRGDLILFMELLDSLDLAIINDELVPECYRLTGITPKHLIDIIRERLGDNA